MSDWAPLGVSLDDLTRCHCITIHLYGVFMHRSDPWEHIYLGAQPGIRQLPRDDPPNGAQRDR